MTYKFRLQLRFAITALLLAGLVVSCSKNDILSSPDTDSPEIDFSIPSLSRAVVTSSNDMSAFDVWGWYSPTSGAGTATKVFDARKVTNTGSGWKYDIPERWQQGNTYRFYAVYPSAGNESKYETASCTESGYLTITNFDCSHAVDLMTASEKVECPENGYPGKVTMKFSHELAKLNFIVKSENTIATITSFKVYGVNYKGTLTKSSTATWNQVTTATQDKTPYTYTDSFEFNTTNGWEKDIFGDVLLIPDSDLTGAKLEITYKYPGETDGATTSVIDLETSQSPSWVAGQSYKYTLTIKGGSLSVNVTVNPWDGKDTSVSWE